HPKAPHRPCQASKATVIFWTADLRVTASTRIVSVMTLHTRCAVASPDLSRGRGGAGGLREPRPSPFLPLGKNWRSREGEIGMTPPLDRVWKAPARPGLSCLSDIGGHRTRRASRAVFW